MLQAGAPGDALGMQRCALAIATARGWVPAENEGPVDMERLKSDPRIQESWAALEKAPGTFPWRIVGPLLEGRNRDVADLILNDPAPFHPMEVELILGIAKLNLGEPAEAAVIFGKVWPYFPTRTLGELLAHAQRAAGRTEDARKTLEQAMRLPAS
jgi:hypothetical protein